MKCPRGNAPSKANIMAITDKVRKMLWGRSGNHCAVCKHELVVAATPTDDESVIGEECHIISPRPHGPRYDSMLSKEQVDLYDNLILLCRVHHKMVDDQHETYTTTSLRAMKAKHEKWVSEKLSANAEPKPIRVRRIKGKTPAYLTRITSGKEILGIVSGACASSFDHDELESEEDAELVGSFLQTIQDWGDIGPELGPSEMVQTGFELTKSIKALEDAGFLVFGVREVRMIEGGFGGPSNWPVAEIRVLRKSNESIIAANLGEEKPKAKCKEDQ